MTIFHSVGDVAIMIILIGVTFSDLFSGTIFRLASPDKYAVSDWYKKGVKRIPLIGFLYWWWVLPLLWFIVKILVIASLYIFYQQTGLNDWFGKTCDTVTLLFIFNAALGAIWVPVFFKLRWPILGALICAGLVGTGIAILVFFTKDSWRFTNSFWLFLWYVLWCGVVLIMNCAWMIYDYSKKSSSKKQAAVENGTTLS